MSYTNRLAYEPLRTISSTTFTGSYQALGTALTHPCSIVKIVNNSTVLITVSIDGVNDHDVVPAGSFFLYDETANAIPNFQGVFDAQGTQYFVKGSAGTGSVYLVVKYIVTN